MLFLLAMEPLHLLCKKAQELNLLRKLSPACKTFRISLYVDDVALFLNPSEHELKVLDEILQLFAAASGLVTNMEKTQFYPIACENINQNLLVESRRAVPMFPCNYLGLPLNLRKPIRSSWQPMV
jgi:hypothetical protein